MSKLTGENDVTTTTLLLAQTRKSFPSAWHYDTNLYGSSVPQKQKDLGKDGELPWSIVLDACREEGLINILPLEH